MFRENKSHLQNPLFNTLDALAPKQRELLEGSWAGVFRREVFERLDESVFAVLYAEQDSRPNAPVNVLVSLEVLKAGHGWTDQQMMEHLYFNVQVRYAVGYADIGESTFTLRTVYNFRQRLAQHMQETDENLVAQAFVQVTDEQLEALELSTAKLRTDSTQIASYIQEFSRLHLLVDVVQRVWRTLPKSEQAAQFELFAPYVQGESEQFVHRLPSAAYRPRLEELGYAMAQMVSELASTHAETPAYQMLVRVFGEHFVWTADEVRLKESAELAATNVQAPADPEATFRRKQDETYRGYVTNLTETCAPENDVQLIVDVQTEPNVADDAQMLRDAVPDLVERMEVETIYADGGYNSPETDAVLDEHDIELVQTAIRGGKPDPNGLNLTDFHFETDAARRPTAATCPAGQRFAIEPGRADGRFIGRPDAEQCGHCPLLSSCPVRPQQDGGTPALYLEKRQVRTAQRRQALKERPKREGNLRAAVEATVRSVKHPFRHGKLLVRGRFRVACQMLGSALMVNVRRIHQHATRSTAVVRAQRQEITAHIVSAIPTFVPNPSDLSIFARKFTFLSVGAPVSAQRACRCNIARPTLALAI